MTQGEFEKRYIDGFWGPIPDARRWGKKVRLDSDRLTLEILRAYRAGWDESRREAVEPHDNRS